MIALRPDQQVYQHTHANHMTQPLLDKEQGPALSHFIFISFQSFKEGVPSTKVVFQGSLHLKMQ